MTTSATGGYLTTPLPDNVALRRFLQGMIVGISGLAATLVRPRWQKNPPPMPSVETNWCAFGISRRVPEAGAYIAPEVVSAKVVRHEAVEVACSFYGPRSEDYAEAFREGLQVSQNREPLLLACMGLASVGPSVHVPELHNQEWYDRTDMSFTVNRETGKVYEILCFTGAIGAIITETLTFPFEVEQY